MFSVSLCEAEAAVRGREVSALIFVLLLLASFSDSAMAQKHTYRLRLGYTVELNQADGEIPGLERIALLKDGRTIFSDTNDQWMEKDAIYPLVLHFGSDHDEILLKYDDRPSKEGVLRLFISGDSVKHRDTLLSFDFGPRDLAGDGRPRFAGLWDWRQQWDSSITRFALHGDVVQTEWIDRDVYEPILCFLLAGDGLRLDTATTKLVNERIYGKFYGFNISEDLRFPVARTERAFSKEWRRISHARKLTLDGY